MDSNNCSQFRRPTRLQGDLIILGSTSPLANPEEILPQPLPSTALPEETLGARYAFSQALARSTALSSIEVSLEDFLSSVSRLPHALHMTGKPDLPRKEIIQKLGHLLKFRQSINLNAENFADAPEVYWSEPALEGWCDLSRRCSFHPFFFVFAHLEPTGYFKAMSNALEIKSRTQVVNAKITYAVEVQSVLRDLLTEVRNSYGLSLSLSSRSCLREDILFTTFCQSSTHRMELIIIGLIAVEVVLVRPLFSSYVPVQSEMKSTIGFHSGRARTHGTLFWEARFRTTALETVYGSFIHLPTLSSYQSEYNISPCTSRVV